LPTLFQLSAFSAFEPLLHPLVKRLVSSNRKHLPHFIPATGLLYRTNFTIGYLSKVVTGGIARFHSYGMEVEYVALLTEVLVL
jgi:hypothetical protein